MQPLTPEQAERILDGYLKAVHRGQASHKPYMSAWAYLTGVLESICWPHLGANAFPATIPEPEQETTE